MHELLYIDCVLRDRGNSFQGMVVCFARMWHRVVAYLAGFALGHDCIVMA